MSESDPAPDTKPDIADTEPDVESDIADIEPDIEPDIQPHTKPDQERET